MKRKSLLTLLATLAVFGVVLTGCNAKSEKTMEEAPVQEEVVREVAVQDEPAQETVDEEAIAVEAEEAADNEIADLAQAIEEERQQKASALESAYFDFFEKKNEDLGREVSEGLYYCYADVNMDFVREIFYVNLEEKKCYLVYTVPNEDGSYTAKEQYICDAHGDNIFHDTFKNEIMFFNNPCSGVVYQAPRYSDAADFLTSYKNQEYSELFTLIHKYTGSDLQKIYADIEYSNGEFEKNDIYITKNLTDYFGVASSNSFNSRLKLDDKFEDWVELDDDNFDSFLQLLDEWFNNSEPSREYKGSDFQYSADAFMALAYDFSRNNVPIMY